MGSLTKREIEGMRALRECGASVREIADIYGISERTVWRYVVDVVSQRDGHQIELVREVMWQWLPQLPWEGMPLPRWLARYLRHEAAKAEARGDAIEEEP